MSSRALNFGWLALLAGVLMGACSGEDDDGGVRGESCRSTADCKQDLACLGGTCSVRTFGVTVTQRECVFVECRDAEDCCSASPACQSFRDACEAGAEASCEQLEVALEALACRADRCVQTCESDVDCFGGACVDDHCAECADDDDCRDGEKCTNHQCEPGCEEKADCPFFHECNDERCVYSGCSSNRECVAATGKSRAECRDGDCLVPCSSDVECDDPSAFEFFACVESQCIPLGCESDEECRIRLDVRAIGGDADCREQPGGGSSSGESAP